MPSEISNHRKGAYIYGFLSGIGLIMLAWGVVWFIGSPARNLATFIALTLFGICLFAFGSCREAYLRGSLSVASTSAADKNQEPLVVTTTQEPILCEQGQQNQA